ncbi:MAG TPA: apolipoprotein N-acyltransferase [Casimicrobiaceae bacterium]|jgi:apolipoprotein N-acyltransferase
MTAARALALAMATVSGIATVIGFAPFGFAHLPVVTLALLFAQWNAATTRRDAAELGFAFGLGLFGAGVSWVYIALETFGGMPTAIALLATALFVGYLAAWPAVAGYVAVRFTGPHSVARVLAAASLWTLCEWLRGWLFTGMPWLSLGYAQLPGSMLAGYAPIGGVFLVSFAVALTAAMIALIVDALTLGRCLRIAACATVCVALYFGGAALAGVEWTRQDGTPLTVSLVQGNILQDVKFDPEFRERTFQIYAQLVRQSSGKLIVLPESAYPMFSDEVPDRVLLNLARTATARGGDVLLGLFTAEAPLPGSDEPRYFNTVLTLGSSELQLYRKRHLVPFGETIPGKPILGWFIRSVLAIPIADQTPGDPEQPPFAVAGTRVAVNICYEDAFGTELIDGARTARILINVTNDAWYGHSIAAWQHNQMAAMRALELGRPLLRATNTGVTSAIGDDGRILATIPWFTRGVLEVTVQGRTGATPYYRIVDWLAVGIALALAVAACWLGAKRAR